MDKQYVWGARYVDELVCRDDATPQRLYAMQDANFNLTSIANTSGGVVERYLFDPYGTRMIMNASWGVISTSPYNWVIGNQGLNLDSESGLIYIRYRYLQPALGVWSKRDPFGYEDGYNVYVPLRSSPVNNIDPFGLSAAPCTPARFDQIFAEYINASHTYYSGEPNPYFNLSTSEIYQIAQRAFNEECDATQDDPYPVAAPQDGICSSPMTALNVSTCYTACCRAHDNCYTFYGCNAGSWSGGGMWYGNKGVFHPQCEFICNAGVVACVLACTPYAAMECVERPIHRLMGF